MKDYELERWVDEAIDNADRLAHEALSKILELVRSETNHDE